MTRASFASFICALAAGCACLFTAPVAAQQNNLHVLPPPSVDFSRERTRDISAGYASVGGARINAGCLDVNLTFGSRTSSSTYRSTSFGTALIGGVGPERVYLDQVKKDINGVTIHASGNKHYLFGRGEYPRWALLTSIPLSFGSFTIGNNNKEETAVYNFLTGLQGGAALNYKAGDYMLTPSLAAGLLGGYREKYKGGVYLKNLRSGVVKPFLVLTLGAELHYLPRQFKAAAAWQRAFSSGEDRATDSLMLQFSFGWDFWGRRSSSGETPPIEASPL
ncbi:MAG: hypothetical protein CVU79_00455 [Elusimicrobia bacterium HGW-Elusimicrobia-3]|jgi:hypothetical protein|nr:MAG: hypothetical protein CVU79_00455 [Elusimicrobia bacterium HGW-Elusimicrobia-3]